MLVGEEKKNWPTADGGEGGCVKALLPTPTSWDASTFWGALDT